MMPFLCGRPTATGSPCGTVVTRQGEACLWHDPARQDKARDARSKGARTTNAKRNPTKTVKAGECPAPPETTEDAVKWLSWLAHSVTIGRVDARTCEEATGALKAFLAGQKELDRNSEKLKALQEKLANLRKGA